MIGRPIGISGEIQGIFVFQNVIYYTFTLSHQLETLRPEIKIAAVLGISIKQSRQVMTFAASCSLLKSIDFVDRESD